MESSTPPRVLVVAHRTAATPALLQAVADRAARGRCTFTLLVPNTTHGLARLTDPEDEGIAEAQAMLKRALPLLQEAAGAPVQGAVGDPDPLNAVQDFVNLHGADEIIISTLPVHLSRWLRLDLPHKLSGLGLPLTTITAREGAAVHA